MIDNMINSILTRRPGYGIMVIDKEAIQMDKLEFKPIYKGIYGKEAPRTHKDELINKICRYVSYGCYVVLAIEAIIIIMMWRN